MSRLKHLLALLACLCLLASCGAWAEEIEVVEYDAAGLEPEVAPTEADALALEGGLTLLEAEEETPPLPNADNEEAEPEGTGVEIDAKHFPDASFRALVNSEYDTDGDGTLSNAELKRIETVDVRYENDLTSLKGIEYFTELKSLYLSDAYSWDNSKALDLSKNTKLRTLICDCTPLHRLNISRNIDLEVLDCEDCGLEALNVSNNTKLRKLDCTENRFTKLDISACPQLVKCVKEGKRKLAGAGLNYTYGENRLSIDEHVKLYTDPVNKVVITNGAKATMQVDDGLLLRTKLSPAGSFSSLRWSSSDSKVATVSQNGVVVARKRGTAKITVKTANGKRDSITITVKARKARTELAGYMGDEIDDAQLTKLGLKFKDKDEDDYGRDLYRCYYTGKELEFHILDPDRKVCYIELKKGTKYSMAGITLGMNLKTARDKAMKYIREKYGNELEGSVRITDKTLVLSYEGYDLPGRDGDVWKIRVVGKNGVVTNISFQEGDIDIN